MDRSFDSSGVRLVAETRGRGRPVVLLHGFPETHRSWEQQTGALVERGFQAIALDLRGYGRSARPSSGYDLPTLADDVAAVIRQLDRGPVAVVGHDWGGVVTWELLSRHAPLVDRAVILDAPHPALMARALRRNPRQLARSWYMFFFQLPSLPERWLARRAGRNIARMFRPDWPLASAATAAIVEAEGLALLEPGALGAALAYYRTALRDNAAALLRDDELHLDPIEVPVTVIWGERDSCLGPELNHGLTRFVRDLTVHIVAGAGHFVHQERPDEVNALLLRALE